MTLTMYGNGEPSVALFAESESERAILAFLAEGKLNWTVFPSYNYRPGGVEKVELTSRVIEGELIK